MAGRTRTAALVALAAATLGIAGVASAGGVQRFETEVTFEAARELGGGPTCRGVPCPVRARGATAPVEILFYGRVRSTNNRCLRLRRVNVFVKRPAGAERIGYDASDNNGTWALIRSSEGLSPSDTYFAKAPRKKLPNGNICKPDRSPDFTPSPST